METLKKMIIILVCTAFIASQGAYLAEGEERVVEYLPAGVEIPMGYEGEAPTPYGDMVPVAEEATLTEYENPPDLGPLYSGSDVSYDYDINVDPTTTPSTTTPEYDYPATTPSTTTETEDSTRDVLETTDDPDPGTSGSPVPGYVEDAWQDSCDKQVIWREAIENLDECQENVLKASTDVMNISSQIYNLTLSILTCITGGADYSAILVQIATLTVALVVAQGELSAAETDLATARQVHDEAEKNYRISHLSFMDELNAWLMDTGYYISDWIPGIHMIIRDFSGNVITEFRFNA